MIHFSHGNGFPAETYHQIIKGLNSIYDRPVSYISCLGHNPDYLVINNWSNLVDEVIDFISKNYTEKAVAIGHSLGGVISYLACAKRPDLFKAVILLDAPIYSNIKNISISIIKALGLIEYFTPAKNTKYRRFIWPNHEEALRHFKNKRVFRYYTDLCLRDYVYFGTEKISDKDNNTSVKLKFDPIVEWKIYRTLPSFKFPKLPVEIPCCLMYGEYSKVISDKDARAMVLNYNVQLNKIANCGHLFPFEQPQATVSAIVKFITENCL